MVRLEDEASEGEAYPSPSVTETDGVNLPVAVTLHATVHDVVVGHPGGSPLQV